jgi:hypothetical protein
MSINEAKLMENPKKDGKIQLKKKPTAVDVKKKKYKISDSNKRCQARVSTGAQCQKSHKADNEFCGWHLRYIPYGRYDGPLEGKFLTIPKKRGRKFRNDKEYKLEDLDLNMYIKTQVIMLNNEKYRLDENGILYTNDNDCYIVGRRQDDLIYWYN